MQKEKKDKHFIKKPTYPGGMKALKELISKNLKYPKKALEEKIEGTVYLKYTLNHKGDVIETKVISSVGYGCDEEAERLVKMLKFETPKTRGIKILYHKNIQIHFRLPKEKVIKAPKVKVKSEPLQAPTIQYNIVPSKATPKVEPKVNPKKKGGSYTIKINL